MDLQVTENDDAVEVRGETYRWRLDRRAETFELRDSTGRPVAQGGVQPAVEVVDTDGNTSTGAGRLAAVDVSPEEGVVTLRFDGVNGEGTTTTSWHFRPDSLRLAPVRYTNPRRTFVETLTLFGRWGEYGAVPGLHCQFFLHPGSTESSILAPVIPAKVRLSIVSTIGRGSTDEPGFVQQQWGLPMYFWGGWSIDGWGSGKSARTRHTSDVVILSMDAIPTGDQHIRYFDEYASPYLRLLGGRWKTFETGADELELGTGWLWSLGPDIRTAIAGSFDLLRREGIVADRNDSARKARRATMSQFNTWGAQVANDWASSDLNQDALEQIYDDMVASGFDAEMFVIDDRWESAYGQLQHDDVRFPRFAEFLDRVRADGRGIGMWAAFIRCQDPESMGLTLDDVWQDPEGRPVTRSLFDDSYYLFDVSRPHVAERLAETAKRFMHRYRPDLVKFDFGYELPSMRDAAPARREWGGERALLESLRVVVGAMREVDPDVVVMYYNLSPLLLDFVDQHSTDDLYLNAGEYPEEVNRRLFFSSLLSPLGVPTYGSGGYDWLGVTEIWFDTVASGPLGSLNSFNGDQSDSAPTDLAIARQRGLRQLTRRNTRPARVEAVDARLHGGSMTARARSWVRYEEEGPTVVAARPDRREGEVVPWDLPGVVRTTGQAALASRDEASITDARSLGLVAATAGTTRFRTSRPGTPTMTAVLRDRELDWEVRRDGDWIEADVAVRVDGEPVEWYRIEFPAS
jgi:hypothetical protein